MEGHDAADRNGEQEKVDDTKGDGFQRASAHGVRFVVGGGAVSGMVVADTGTAAGVAVAELEVAFGAVALS